MTEAAQPALAPVFPIAEIFESICGEGRWTGKKMTFIRMAGCNVGRPYTAAARETLGLQTYQHRCGDALGGSFACDTDYRVRQNLTMDEILVHELVRGRNTILLTGGEPLMHARIDGLIRLLLRDHHVHIETSGTKDLYKGQVPADRRLWIAVAPKVGCLVQSLYRADEIKVLVGADFDEDMFVRKYQTHFDKVVLAPVNDEHELCYDNLRQCIALVHKYDVMMTQQSHKIWKVR